MPYEDHPDRPPRYDDDEPLPVERERGVALTSDDRTWGMLCHLSALVGWVAVGMGFLGPLICWLIKKDTSPFVDAQGKEALNFQLNILIYILITIPIAIATCGIGLILTVAVAVYGLIIMPIIAGLKANGGEMYQYPLTFRLIK
jgi:uncharacterized Tic20 family protein